MKPKYHIVTKSPQEHQATLGALMELGFQWHGERTTAKEASEEYGKDYPTIAITLGNKHLAGNFLPHDGEPVITLSDFLMEYCNDKRVEVKLNDQHTAIVTEDGIQVNCQTFPLSVVEELAEAVKRVTKTS